MLRHRVRYCWESTQRKSFMHKPDHPRITFMSFHSPPSLFSNATAEDWSTYKWDLTAETLFFSSTQYTDWQLTLRLLTLAEVQQWVLCHCSPANTAWLTHGARIPRSHPRVGQHSSYKPNTFSHNCLKDFKVTWAIQQPFLVPPPFLKAHSPAFTTILLFNTYIPCLFAGASVLVPILALEGFWDGEVGHLLFLNWPSPHWPGFFFFVYFCGFLKQK